MRYRSSVESTCFAVKYKNVGLSSMKQEPKSGLDVRQNTGLITKADSKKITSMTNKKMVLALMIN